MKFVVSLNVPSVEIDSTKPFKTPDLGFHLSTELDKEEYLALLPHLYEMRKEANGLLRDLGRGIKEAMLPELLAIAKQSFDASQKEDRDRHEIDMDERRSRLKTFSFNGTRVGDL